MGLKKILTLAGAVGLFAWASVFAQATTAQVQQAQTTPAATSAAAPQAEAPQVATASTESAAISADSTKSDSVTVEKNPYDLPDELMPLWNSMSLKQKAAQMVMVYMSPVDFLVNNEFGAVLVMKSHLKNPDKFQDNIAKANDKLKIPLLVATDQEGGMVNRLGGFSKKWASAPSAMEMRSMETDSVEAIAQSIGEELYQTGINLNLAPVLDPAYDHRKKHSFMEVSKRSWEKDSTSVDKVRAFVRGMRKSNVACVSKHFPGYDSWTNSDHQIAISASPKDKIAHNVSFFSALADDIPVTMMSSVRFIRISNKPAVFESRVVKMARDMSPETVILTDDLWGVSLRAWISGTERVKSKTYPTRDFKKLIRTALEAGNDMFMITYPAKAVEMVKYLVAMSKQNKKYKKRIEESAARILKMKFKAGIYKPEAK